MDNYFLFTREKDFIRWSKNKVRFILIPLWGILAIITALILIVISFSLFTKKTRKEWFSTWRSMVDCLTYNMDKSRFLDLYGSYSWFTDDVLINLEGIFKSNKSEDEIIRQSTNTIVHEDIHKCLRFEFDYQEGVVKKMGY